MDVTNVKIHADVQGVHEIVLRFPLAVAQYKMITQSFFLYQ